MENPNDMVRVLRVVEYVGRREDVEDTLARSIHGPKVVQRRGNVSMTISAVVIEATPEIDAALAAAASESEKMSDLCAEACAALGWEVPSTPSERSNGAIYARRALDASQQNDWFSRPKMNDAKWPLFVEKVREIVASRDAHHHAG